MKIGDQVRFLSEVGGGRVSGFQGKNIVLVEDEDGFEIPMLMQDVVVVGNEEYDSSKVNTIEREKPLSKTPIKAREQEDHEEKPITFKPKPLERREGERLNLYLSFLPDEVKEISSTGFESYLVNDSNYYLYYTYSNIENQSCLIRSQGLIEPNTKLFFYKMEI